MLIYYSFWNEFILKYDNEQHIFDYSIALNEFHKIQINNEWSTIFCSLSSMKPFKKINFIFV